ncbi:phosphoenolpyruvate carboxykinase (ATP) [Thermodesulfobium acidiphilum]|uniref:Phosphoenolpyruvate carboxykinase (ATP) n=2 Tax=Thermodesulfobium acidiphilum TaxID=1794699 RepID=A0A2R4VZH1_THEAF|nr:phosphoenolpyruvate carboxykinase (ATP) [Thermodesulfobium acidiphilum]
MRGDELKAMSNFIPKNVRSIKKNLSVPELIELAIKNGEGVLSSDGSLCVRTGKFTGRSPNDRFIVYDDITKDTVDWGKINLPLPEENYKIIKSKASAYMQNKDILEFSGSVGADPDYQFNVHIFCEYAFSALFSKFLFINSKNKIAKNSFTMFVLPGFSVDPETDKTNSDAAIILNLKEKTIIISGSMYCGEIKKAIFTCMNYFLPEKEVLPMHCSANIGKNNDVALFFGLSGTGKTTLSNDPERKLIGDDEHGWSENGIFNFEGGCYAKCINLSRENEPIIYNSIKFGSLLENVILTKDRTPDYTDSSITENTRAAYPMKAVSIAHDKLYGPHPKCIIFLTADAFGVMPPVAKLSPQDARDYFLCGYTSKLAGTERGIIEPQTTFSFCFGAPFMPRKPIEYASLLEKKIREHSVRIYLLNTGWIGGPFGIGKRIDIKTTRTIVKHIIEGTIENSKFIKDKYFGLTIPEYLEGIAPEILNPINSWENKEEYTKKAIELAKKIENQIKKHKE